MDAMAITPAILALLLTPFWKSPVMTGESLFFVQPVASERPCASLLFFPKKDVRLQSATGTITYKEGQDFIVEPAKRRICLPAGSKVPFKTDLDLHPVGKSRFAIERDKFHPKRKLLFGEGTFFHELQSAATYEHDEKEWAGPVPPAGKLPRTLAKLAAKQPLKIVVLGDSISAGYNASDFVSDPPHQPPYPGLIGAELERRYGARVTVKNLSVSGMMADWGAATIPQAVIEKPDLTIIAFGVNDSANRIQPAIFLANTLKQLDGLRAKLPDSEVLLVSPMLANPEWSGSAPGLVLRYRDGLVKLKRPGVEVADVTGVWAELVKRKSFLDLTGNGVNHPNDFGHRVYAQVILSTISAPPPAP